MTGVVASAELVAVRRGARTRCEVMRSAPPLTFRVTGTTVHLVGTAGGPVGGDRLTLRIALGPGAALDLRSVAATVVLPGPHREPSSLDVDLDLADGATLRWTPRPLVAARGADHRMRIRARLAPGARLRLEDTVVLGRTGEAGGSVAQRLDVDVDGVARLRSELRLGPRWEEGDGPATTGGARVVAQVVAIGDDVASVAVPFVDGVRGGVMALRGGGVLAAMLGADSASVERAVGAVHRALDAARAVTPA